MTFLLLPGFLLTLAGFHGLFFWSKPFSKAWNWMIFQAGLILFWIPFTGLSQAWSQPLAVAALVWMVLSSLGVFAALLLMATEAAGPNGKGKE